MSRGRFAEAKIDDVDRQFEELVALPNSDRMKAAELE